MFYNNKNYRLARNPIQIAFSNSLNPADFAANVYRVMMTRNDPSVPKAIDAMADSNSTYNGVNIKLVPELQELYRRTVYFSGPITQRDLENNLTELFRTSGNQQVAPQQPQASTPAPQQSKPPEQSSTTPQAPISQPQESYPQQPTYPQSQNQQNGLPSISQMYGPQDLRNYQSTMELQKNSLTPKNAPSMKNSYIATFDMYEKYLMQNNITDPNYNYYRNIYDEYKNPPKVEPKKQKILTLKNGVYVVASTSR